MTMREIGNVMWSILSTRTPEHRMLQCRWRESDAGIGNNEFEDNGRLGEILSRHLRNVTDHQPEIGGMTSEDTYCSPCIDQSPVVKQIFR